ncbi:MAG: SDR family oxidoreductase [Thermoflavifilum sp.]|nr:SDR family oxidoreductase [Thermoflavifilum sp.]
MRYALVTGASGGIGKELARCLASRKWNLLLVARDEKALAELAKELSQTHQIDVHYRSADLAKPAEVESLVEWVNGLQVPLGVLVNNAGYGVWGAFETVDWQAQQQMLQVNVMALLQITHRLLPLLKASGKPAYILQVGSLAGYLPLPYFNLYAASKALVNSFTRALACELRQHHIHVCLLAPGAVATRFNERAGLKDIPAAQRYAMPADAVAKAAVNGLFKGKAIVMPGYSNRIMARLVSCLPKGWSMAVVARIYKPSENQTSH